MLAGHTALIYGIRRLGVRVPPSAPSSQARCRPVAGFLFVLGATVPRRRSNRARLIGSAVFRLSPSSRCLYTSFGDSDAGVPEYLGDHVHRRALSRQRRGARVMMWATSAAYIPGCPGSGGWAVGMTSTSCPPQSGQGGKSS